MTTYSKPCPECASIITFKRKPDLNYSLKHNCRCRSCRNRGKNHPMFGVKRPKEFCDKVSERTKGVNNPRYGVSLSDEQKQKISKANKGRKPTNIEVRKGKTLEEIYGIEKAKIIRERYKNRPNPTPESNIQRSIKCRNPKCGQKNKGKKWSPERKRLYRLQFIERLNATHKNFHPPYNKKACEYFGKLMMEQNCFIQHALNGGEYHIEELGYWLDGYDKQNNIAYEFDEKRHHYYNGMLKEKDKIRQQQIEDFLKCKFIRIKESDLNN